MLGVALAGLIFEPRADFRVTAARGRVTDGVLMPEDPVTSRTAAGSVPPLAATTERAAIDLGEIPQVPEFAVDDLRGFLADISFHRCGRPTPTMLEYFDFFVPGQAEAIRSEEICGWGATHIVQREQRGDVLSPPTANLVALDEARNRSVLAFLGLSG